MTANHGRVTTYTYDTNGRLVKTERPEGSVEICTYDKTGKIRSWYIE